MVNSTNATTMTFAAIPIPGCNPVKKPDFATMSALMFLDCIERTSRLVDYTGRQLADFGTGTCNAQVRHEFRLCTTRIRSDRVPETDWCMQSPWFRDRIRPVRSGPVSRGQRNVDRPSLRGFTPRLG